MTSEYIICGTIGDIDAHERRHTYFNISNEYIQKVMIYFVYFVNARLNTGYSVLTVFLGWSWCT